GGHEEVGVVGSFLRMIELASVCRQWRFHLTAHICRTAIVECKRNAVPEHCCRWVSNINFITAMGLSNKTEELYISDIDGKGTSSVTTLKLGRFTFKDTETGQPWRYWLRLFLFSPPIFPPSAMSTTQLDGPPGTCGITLRAMLINHYTANSKTVYIREWYLTASLGLLRQDITKLDINASFVFGAPRDLRLPNSALRCLRLTDAGRGFQWNWFRNGADGQRIVFPELVELTLEFVYIGDEMGTKSFAGFGLSFPKLQKLSTLDALLYYSDFYTTFIDSPICPTEGPPAPLYLENPYDNLLPADSMVRAATLVSIPSYMLPEINWTNLWNLRLNLNKLEFEPIDTLLGHIQYVAKWICNLVLHTPVAAEGLCSHPRAMNEIRNFADLSGKVLSCQQGNQLLDKLISCFK
ncbi:hypothetical protein DL89DRAFT_268572, partial [Linderina pennispora]